jgi:hypothetical protein
MKRIDPVEVVGYAAMILTGVIVVSITTMLLMAIVKLFMMFATYNYITNL